MNTKSIKITIDKDGNISVETSGFTGDACNQATAGFEALLGGEIDKQFTEEFFQDADAMGQSGKVQL